jgi:glycosyltransferase involved in cell wall biosynthesis
MNTLSIVIPAYNEEAGIAQIIERVLPIRAGLQGVGVDDLELIVVDDGSRDRTAEIAGRYPEVRLLRHTVNQGYGAALKTGFGRAQGNLLGFLDADGTYPPEHFPDLCRVALVEEADLVIGSRMAGADSEMPLMRRVGNLIFANLLSVLGNHHVSDSTSGMRVIRREALSRLYPLPDGLNFTPVMSTRALHEDIHWREVPIPYQERLGRSKLNVVRDGMRFLNTIVWTALNYNPARILGSAGLGLALLAAAIGAIVVGLRLAGVNQLGPWGVGGVYLGALSAFAGLTLFSLGVTFNYLVSLFHERPIHRPMFGIGGLFGKRPLFWRPLERHFGWLGLLALFAGGVLGVTSLILGLDGWPIYRLWFYLLAAALSAILGLQLLVFWVITQVLGKLSQRQRDIARDLEGKPCQ